MCMYFYLIGIHYLCTMINILQIFKVMMQITRSNVSFKIENLQKVSHL